MCFKIAAKMSAFFLPFPFGPIMQKTEKKDFFFKRQTFATKGSSYAGFQTGRAMPFYWCPKNSTSTSNRVTEGLGFQQVLLHIFRLQLGLSNSLCRVRSGRGMTLSHCPGLRQHSSWTSLVGKLVFWGTHRQWGGLH